MGEEADADWEQGLIEMGEDNTKGLSPYRDPTCPKCGIGLGDKMFYVCRQRHCPSGLN